MQTKKNEREDRYFNRIMGIENIEDKAQKGPFVYSRHLELK